MREIAPYVVGLGIVFAVRVLAPHLGFVRQTVGALLVTSVVCAVLVMVRQ
jgi:hypothetical protein